MTLPTIRKRPPWNDGGPSLRVGYDPARQEYILRAPGGHIIGATTSLEAVGDAIRFESEWGFGSMELRLQGCTTCQTHHGLREARTNVPRKARTNGRDGKITLSLEDLGLA